jgi:hypothetical protein
MLNFKPAFDKDDDPGKPPGTMTILRRLYARRLYNNRFTEGLGAFEPVRREHIHSCNDNKLS